MTTLWLLTQPLCAECQALETELHQRSTPVNIFNLDGRYITGELGIPRDAAGEILKDSLDVLIAIQVEAAMQNRLWPPPLPVGVLQNGAEMKVGFGKDQILELAKGTR